jgi:threonine dehydratase
VLTVSEADIVRAVRDVATQVKLVAEPSGAVAAAAARVATDALEGPVVCVISGGNVDVKWLASVLAAEV